MLRQVDQDYANSPSFEKHPVSCSHIHDPQLDEAGPQGVRALEGMADMLLGPAAPSSAGTSPDPAVLGVARQLAAADTADAASNVHAHASSSTGTTCIYLQPELLIAHWGKL